MSLAKAVMNRLRELREIKGISQTQLEENLILGPGWIERFESARSLPSLELLLLIVQTIGATPDQLFTHIAIADSPIEVAQRCVYVTESGSDLHVHFEYGDHDATYCLIRATEAEYASVVKTMRDGLAPLAVGGGNSESLKTEAVARTFLRAAQVWPHANPSDLWWFLVSRLYGDPFNHPAIHARLNLEQSWKRTGGWALEEVLVRHYSSFLASKGISISIPTGQRKEQLVGQFQVSGRLEADKVDVVLTGRKGAAEVAFGVVHVKASFAERRTDDVPLSEALVRAGYTSPLWTMDCKSTPSANPINKGELGPAKGPVDQRSAKRKDIEDEGFFSACFSYNRNTLPTPDTQNARARVIVCDFSSPDDAFSQFVITSWEQFTRG